ncbi:MAG: glycosyltransferase family 4 protein [Flavobacteriaceae bacterium]|nr:glycosyltransferase family 4 protein [Flavobacteriaceae bacterium]
MNLQKVLIIGAVWVEPNSSAAGSRMLQLIQLFLENNYKVTFATTASKTEKAFALKAIGVEEQTIQLNDISFNDFVKEINPTIVVFDRFMIEEQFGWRVAENCPAALRILDTEDLHSLRKVRHEAIKKQKDFRTKDLLNSAIAKREIASILRCDVSLIISSYEIKLLKEVFKIDPKLFCYLPFLLDKIDKKRTRQWKLFEERNHFVFVGNFLHAPNVDAVLQLKKHVWKPIRKQLPKAEIHIYGAYPTQQILELHNEKEGFVLKGFVKEIQEVVLNAKVVLAPLRFGAGIKGKLTEAMLCGTPSVTTTIGAEGMHNDLPWNGFIEDDFERFAEKAVQLFTNKDLWNASQQNGVEIINAIYDKEKLSIPFIRKIEKTQENLESHRQQNFLGSMLHHQSLQATKYLSKWIEAKNKNIIKN